jgi:hypothetical protein
LFGFGSSSSLPAAGSVVTPSAASTGSLVSSACWLLVSFVGEVSPDVGPPSLVSDDEGLFVEAVSFDVDDVDAPDESEAFGSAQAIPGLLATAAPMPKATASAPTRPTKAAHPRLMGGVIGRLLDGSSRGIDIEAHFL